jgi:hypothetical protein
VFCCKKKVTKRFHNTKSREKLKKVKNRKDYNKLLAINQLEDDSLLWPVE